jgi:agmatinase
MRTFAGIERSYAGYDQSEILLLSIPYDGTSTWGKGADKGFERFLDASENMELYDIETGTEVYRKGIHLLPELDEKSSPEVVFEKVYRFTQKLLNTGKFLTFFGGEHSVSIGIMQAFREYYPGLTVLQLDAHADLRSEYLGSKYNHACALHDISRHTNLIQVGIRSMDAEEVPYLNREQCFFADALQNDIRWMDKAIDMMGDMVYITLDLDVLDPSIMPGTGTPEPGGLDWYILINFLRKVFRERNVMGFDIVELAPIQGMHSPEFLVAKLYYKMLTYKFLDHER